MFASKFVVTGVTRPPAPFRRSFWRAVGPASEQTNDAGPPLLLTVAEASAALRISRWSLYQLIRSGQLKTIKIGRRRVIPASALAALVRNLSDEDLRL